MTTPARPPSSSSGGTNMVKAVTLIVVVVFVGWLVLRHNPSSSHASTPTTAHGHTTTTLLGPTTTTVPVVPPASIKLQVLNGVGSGSYAGQFSARLRTSPGYNTLAADNATTKVLTSEIYIMTTGYLPEARALAATVGLSDTAINTTIPAPPSAPILASERAAANLVLVIGPDLAGRT